MQLHKASVLAALAFTVVVQNAPEPASAQSVAGVRVRVDVLKKWTLEPNWVNGPLLVGPQSALELEWRLLNTTGWVLEIPSPGTVLRLRVMRSGREIPVDTQWAADMTLRGTINGEFVSTTVPVGATSLPEGASLWVRGSTKPQDGSAFAPGDYVVELDFTGEQQSSTGGAPIVASVDRGSPMRLRIVALDSPERQRQFHMIEGAFYSGVDRSRALQHYVALASLPGAQWSDSLPLASMYGKLGRHREASMVFRRILPDLTRALDGSLGPIIREAGHLRRAAMSLAVEGDVVGATNLLRLEGRTPQARIPAEIERLRKSAPKPGRDPK